VRVDQIRTRLFGDKVYVDVEISVSGDASLQEAHDIAHQVHDEIEGRFPKVKHCMVHVNPADPASR
jgi:divalent metal cation (Fe/Co/Zn/Cd) transporter